MKDTSFNERTDINSSFVLAALSIPLNNKMNNFERLSFSYLPKSMKDFDEANSMAKEELRDTAKMLQVEGQPSRHSIIHYISVENIHMNTDKHVSELFNLIEHEESPFTISKRGKIALDAISKIPALVKYTKFIAKTLSVRILQKCKSFYQSMKITKLLKIIPFYESINEVEMLIYECNREGFVHTTINYHQHPDGCLTFNSEA